MTIIERHAPNTFCWPELTSTDVSRAKSFYRELFGWFLHDDSVPGGGVYTLARRGDHNVCGLFQNRPDQQHAGLPSHWTAYVSVADVDETAARVTDNGGKILAPPFDVMDAGRMAVVQDPAGAMFSLWQPRRHIGTQIRGEAGTPSWYELTTPDVEGAKRFYGAVFGWQSETYGGEYTQFFPAGEPLGKSGNAIAGMMARPSHMSSVPPTWLVYFDAEVDVTATRAAALGGTAIVPPQDIPNVGRFSVLRDPTGGVFAVLRLSDHGQDNTTNASAAASPKAKPKTDARSKKTANKTPKRTAKRSVKTKAKQKAKTKVKTKAKQKAKTKAKTKTKRKAKSKTKTKSKPARKKRQPSRPIRVVRRRGRRPRRR